MILAEFYEKKSFGDYYRINSSWKGNVQECYEYCGQVGEFNNYQECLCNPLMKTKAYTNAAGKINLLIMKMFSSFLNDSHCTS